MKDKLIIKKNRFSAKMIERLTHFFGNEHYIPYYEAQENDVFICGYPKSGNTWLQNLIVGGLFGIETSLLPDALTQEIIPDVHYKRVYKRYFGDVKFFKTHHLPQKRYKKQIHLVRDGRDVMASYYAMNKANKVEVTLEEMIKDGKKVFPSKWHVHTRAYIENKHHAEQIVIRYVDLHRNPLKELKKIFDFIDVQRTDEQLMRSIKGNTFDMMKKKEHEFGWANDAWNPDEEFIRKGKVGSYKEEIPEDLIAFFEKEAYAELKHFGYL